MKKKLLVLVMQLAVLLSHAQDSGPSLMIFVAKPVLNDQGEAFVSTSTITLEGAIYHKNKLVITRVNNLDIEVKKDGSFTKQLDLEEGKNEFVIGAIDQESNKNFKKIIIYYKVPIDSVSVSPSNLVKSTMEAKQESQVETPTPTNSSVPEIFALIVGVSEFINDSSHKLKYAAKDALEYYEFIKSPQGGQVPEEQIKLLLNEDATKRNILTELKEMLLYADEDDIFIFYYSGHGQSVNNNKEFCLFPYEIVTKTIDDIEISGISQSEIMNRIEDGRPRKKIMFIDACHSGMLVANQKGQGQMAASLLKSMAEADNTLTILTSSSDNEVSFEDDELGGGHGIFTYYLIEGLQGEADRVLEGNKDGIITVYELYKYVSVKTNLRSKQITGQPQRPDKKCVQCNDFPLSLTGLYDIRSSKVTISSVSAQTSGTESKPLSSGLSSPQSSAPGENNTGGVLQPGGFVLIPKKSDDVIEYSQPINKEDLANVIYGTEDGNKITFYSQYGDMYYFSGWINGTMIIAKGKKLGEVIEFTDPEFKLGLKKGYLLFLSDDLSEVRFTLELNDSRKLDFKMKRRGKATRSALKDQKFANSSRDIELTVYNVYGDDIYLSGHIGNQLVLARGVLKGDAILFVDNSKEWKCSGSIMFNDNWTTGRLQIQNANSIQMEYDIKSSGTRKIHQLKDVTYRNAEGTQTITFDKQYGNDVWFSGYVGLGYIKGKATISGDVLQVTDADSGKPFLPTRFLLNKETQEIFIGLNYTDGQRIETTLPRR